MDLDTWNQIVKTCVADRKAEEDILVLKMISEDTGIREFMVQVRCCLRRLAFRGFGVVKAYPLRIWVKKPKKDAKVWKKLNAAE